MRRGRREGARGLLAMLLALAMVLAGAPAQGMAEAVEEVSAMLEGDALVEEAPAPAEDAASAGGEDGVPEEVVAEAPQVGEGTAVKEIGPEAVEEPAAEPAGELAVLEVQSATVSDPRVVADSSMTAGQRVTWDCVWLGSYPQTFVTDAATVAALDAATGWSASGDLAYGGATYRRLREADATSSYSGSYASLWDWGRASASGYCYFLWEPVKWRVLEADGSTALVVADVGLDAQCYRGTDASVTWENCDVRAWLDRTFWGDALTPAQQGAVMPQPLANDDNITYGTSGGSATTDQVFLLAESDVWSADAAVRHGFAKLGDTYDEARRCKPSDYAHAMGAWTTTSSSYLGNSWWWLRSPGSGVGYSAAVGYDGSVVDTDAGRGTIAIRPALRVSLSSDQVFRAGTACSDGAVSEQAAPYHGTPGGGDIARAKISVPKVSNRTYNGKAQRGVATGTGYTLSGTAKAKNAGTYVAVATPDSRHCWTDGTTAAKTIKWKISKAKQPMRVKAVKRTAKRAKVKKKAVTVAAPLKFTKKAQGKVTYAKVSKGSAKCLTVNKKTGKVTVKRGTKKGTYKVKIKVKAKGNRNYKAGSKTITCKVVVK